MLNYCRLHDLLIPTKVDVDVVGLRCHYLACFHKVLGVMRAELDEQGAVAFTCGKFRPVYSGIDAKHTF
jgi:hypothetical protein